MPPTIFVVVFVVTVLGMVYVVARGQRHPWARNPMWQRRAQPPESIRQRIERERLERERREHTRAQRLATRPTRAEPAAVAEPAPVPEREPAPERARRALPAVAERLRPVARDVQAAPVAPAGPGGPPSNGRAVDAPSTEGRATNGRGPGGGKRRRKRPQAAPPPFEMPGKRTLSALWHAGRADLARAPRPDLARLQRVPALQQWSGRIGRFGEPQNVSAVITLGGIALLVLVLSAVVVFGGNGGSEATRADLENTSGRLPTGAETESSSPDQPRGGALASSTATSAVAGSPPPARTPTPAPATPTPTPTPPPPPLAAGAPYGEAAFTRSLQARGLNASKRPETVGCPQAGVPGARYEATAGPARQAFVVWVYPTTEARARDWATAGRAQYQHGECVPGAPVYWNQNVMLAFEQTTDAGLRSQVVDAFLAMQ